MKKLMFTAIAMVAFSSASMANTIADEEILNEDNIGKLSKTYSCLSLSNPFHVQPVFSNILSGDCRRAWGHTRILALNAGATVQEADFIANGAWMACVGLL